MTGLMQAARLAPCYLPNRHPFKRQHGSNVPVSISHACLRGAAILPCNQLVSSVEARSRQSGKLRCAAPEIETLTGKAKRPQPKAAALSWKWEESDDAVTAYSVFLGLLLAGNLPFLQSNQLADLPYFIGLAACTIYIGAHRGLTTEARQMISIKEGALAPVLASCSLFGVYLLIKYLPDLSLQSFLNIYFWVLGSIAVTGALCPLLRRVGGPLGQKFTANLPKGLLHDKGKSLTQIELAPSDFAALLLGVALASAELASNHSNFTLNNVIACLIATDILQLVGVRSFRTAALMLVGLLLYDVFWVFGSPSVVGDNVMLEVATSEIVTGPMRILFPRVGQAVGEGASFPFSLLGLGDIAIPGLLACLALRYDASRATDMRARAAAAAEAIIASFEPGMTKQQAGDAAAQAAALAYDKVADLEQRQRDSTLPGFQDRSSGSGATSTSSTSGADGAADGRMQFSDAVLYQRAYFTPVMVAYVLGLVAAFAANSITHMGQPALLYIVPSTLGAVVLIGASRGELGRLWAFSDVPSFGMDKDSNAKKK